MKKHDFILIATILTAAILLFAALHFLPQRGAAVQIEVNQKVTATLPLNTDTEYKIKTENGTNTLVIRDGKAQMREADCPDKICVHHRPVSKNGESIICLPHKVIVTVIDSADEAEIDAEV